MDSVFKRKPAFRYAGPSLDSYDHVVLITPVWLRSLAAPMRAFLDTERPLLPAYSVICVMSGYGGFRAVDDIATVTGARPVPSCCSSNTMCWPAKATRPCAASNGRS